MKHAGPAILQTIEPLLVGLSALPGLAERRPGCFYRGSKAFLHFHEDLSGTHADIRLQGPEFTRLRVHTAQEQDAVVAAASVALGTSLR